MKTWVLAAVAAAIFVCGWVVFIENEISDIDGNYAFKHDKLVTKHV